MLLLVPIGIYILELYKCIMYYISKKITYMIKIVVCDRALLR